jgi:hypothetical protein
MDTVCFLSSEDGRQYVSSALKIEAICFFSPRWIQYVSSVLKMETVCFFSPED